MFDTTFRVIVEPISGAGVRVVRVLGDVDIAVEAALAGALEQACAGAPTTLVVDLSALHFMDASGLRAIATAGERLAAGSRLGSTERRLLVLDPSPTVRKMFELTGLGELLDR